LHLKRDDRRGLALGGNKVRNMKYGVVTDRASARATVAAVVTVVAWLYGRLADWGCTTITASAAPGPPRKHCQRDRIHHP